jgi:drug/metabolite transporter (DMT)-like permease
MSSQKAFWLSLATVGVPSILIWGTLLYAIGMRGNDWILYASFILLTVICLTPLVYRNRKNRASSQKPTRDDYLKSALITGSLAIAFSVIAFFHLEYRKESLMNWIMPAGMAIATIIHIRKASKAEKTRYIPNE